MSPRRKPTKEALRKAASVPTFFGAFVISQVGYRKGYRVLSYMHNWGLAYETVGARSADEVALFTGQSRAVVFREQQLFRAIWKDQTPERLWHLMNDQVAEAKAAAELPGSARVYVP